MTKAIRINQTGGPEAMVLEDIELAQPGRGEVRLRHHAIGLNFIDIYFRSGMYPAALPFTPGNEGAGEIVALGKGVKDFEVGDRVAYVSTLGAYAEERNIEANALIKLPKKISYETGAAMMLKGLTAQYLLRRTFKVKPGHTILVHAAAGGVGLMLCQWATALGATVIGTAGSEAKAKLAKKAGAKHVILYNSEDFVARVKAITKGELCDVVYDGVGKTTFPGSLDCLRPLGMFVSYGSASGQVEAFNIGLLQQKGSLFATRPTLFHYIAKREDYEASARDLMKAIARGDLTIPIHARYPLADAAKAHEALAGRTTTGASVLIP
ncbi:MAG: qor [Hyphomicrobiales bacterium]|nr:qor [Hyphomicrobiales bacterium]